MKLRFTEALKFPDRSAYGYHWVKDTVDDQVVQPALKAKQDVAVFVNTEIGKLKAGEQRPLSSDASCGTIASI